MIAARDLSNSISADTNRKKKKSVYWFKKRIAFDSHRGFHPVRVSLCYLCV